ncbi:MAG: UDP-N-acetylglucosamine 2-epimerase (non-hydrolyzing) [Candidatus Electrothrix sp. AUS4]|nr:UDP-N-acetylglucosamine 2-epimerase (non-hydrolyzing) [Candidatus Electrothrix sp. AUS4]
MDKIKVALILGTRPEAIKLIPVYRALAENSKFDPVLISTGQHKEMLVEVFNLFGVKPDIELNVMDKNQTLSDLSSKLFARLGNIFSSSKYSLASVQGDTTTALIAAIVAHYHKIPVAHVEAGLRTYNKWAPFPEESNRRMIGTIADFHFTPTETASNALFKEGISQGVMKVGNTVIDSLFLIQKKVNSNIHTYNSPFAYFFCSLRNF